MLALADALPDRVTAGWNQLLCTSQAGARPAHERAVGVALDLHARRPGRDAGLGRLRRARLLRHARLDALAGHGDVRALDPALHGVLRVPARLGRRRRVARRARHDVELAVLRARRARLHDRRRLGRRGRRPGARPLRRRAGRPERADAPLPRRARAGVGLEGARASTSRSTPCASRGTAAAAATATRAGATRSSSSPRCATALSRSRRPGPATASLSCPISRASTRPRRRACGGAA